MKNVSISQSKRSTIANAGASVPVVEREADKGSLRVMAQALFDPARAGEAAAAIRRIGLKYKPSKKHGATAAIRELRDGGE